MQLKIAYSPCPNDTFMFDALINNRIDTEGLSFTPELADIEKLNQFAKKAQFDILKISYAMYPLVSKNYQILDAGSALGHANGPLLISKTKLSPNQVEDLHIAIPGVHTTANLLLSSAYPNVRRKTEYLFSDIENAVINGQVDAGLLIHENRFTYQERGLHKILDMGAWWEENTGLPIPLGGIMVRRSLPQTTKETINRVLFHSVSYAMEHPEASSDYIHQHAQSMKDDVVRKHIQLYVNNYSLSLGDKGRQAIEGLFERALDHQKIEHLVKPIFAI
jgi:1,4-dihydroxy-6-naphthoate synthase